GPGILRVLFSDPAAQQLGSRDLTVPPFPPLTPQPVNQVRDRLSATTSTSSSTTSSSTTSTSSTTTSTSPTTSTTATSTTTTAPPTSTTSTSTTAPPGTS